MSRVVDSRIAYSDPFLWVQVDTLWGEEISKPTKFSIVRKKPVVVIVPIHADKTVELVHQYRHAVGKHLWEVPAGHIDKGETEEQAAARELKEETGLVAEKLICMGKYLTSPGFTDEEMTFYLALGLTRGQRIIVEGEDDILLDSFTFEAAMCKGSKDLKTSTGLLMAKNYVDDIENSNKAQELGG